MIKKKLSNVNDPHYFICRGGTIAGFIQDDSEVIDLKPFKDSGYANKYAKSTYGKDAYAVFATHYAWDNMKAMRHPFYLKHQAS